MKLNVLITGAGKGLGRAITNEFAKHGHYVYASDRNYSFLKDFESRKNILPLTLDVSNPVSCHEAFEIINSKTGLLDVVINNAGVISFFPISECESEMLLSIFKVNVFGPLNVIQTFLPMLIKSKGRVINISSESYKIPGVFQPYSVSKLAMEAVHRSIRQELMLKGVKTILIRPGAINTGFLNALKNMELPENIPIYKNDFDIFRKMAPGYTGNKADPSLVARLVYKAGTTRHPKYTYHINNNHLLKIFALLPERWQDLIIKKKLTPG
ncbi:MAG: SDR family NAD(P)-dependent oxidoreductase [Bacteroidetes bacterium]|nr:SDR family NAD(P)-dependent oxidoreductase [Bacteroidota bacterium]